MAVLLVFSGNLAWAQEDTERDTDEITEIDGSEEEEQEPDWLQLDAEYRVRTIRVNPYELSGTLLRGVTWTEQRGRVDLSMERPGIGRLVLQMDLYDGVLFGDNGSFGGDPTALSGVSLTARRPNNTAWEVGLPTGSDPLDQDAYVLTLSGVDPIQLNQMYAEVFLPVGLLRFGRQPMSEGVSIALHDGSRVNRWGVSQYGDVSDRLLFATKLDAIFDVITGGDIDSRVDRGLLLGLAYDWNSQGETYSAADDTTTRAAALIWRVPEADWLGLDWRDFELSLSMANLTGETFGTNIWSFPVAFKTAIEDLTATVFYSVFFGRTREISEGFAALSGTVKPVRQHVIAMGAHALLDYQIGPLTLTLEFDYATGDNDPRPDTELTFFNFARDFNVGLLLFEHILAFETARSTAVGLENLISLDSGSFPLTEVSTQTRIRNAVILFPQLKIDLVDTDTHHFHTRFGVMMAWAESGGVDPIMTMLSEDGLVIDDDRVNYFGGAPGSYYGTELDLQLEWEFEKTLIWTVEGALLFPGSSLEDEHMDAVNSYMVENRLVFLF